MKKYKKTAAFLLAAIMMASTIQCGVISNANGYPVITGDTPQEKAESIVSQMTFEEMAGQLLVPRSPGTTTLSAVSQAALQNNNIGGVCLFSGDISGTITQAVELIDAIQREAVNNSRFHIPLFVSIDQEGGYIIRTGQKATIMPGNMALGSSYNPEMAYKAAKVIGVEIAALGFNVNFAPSLDINSNPNNPVIGVRSFGDNPTMVGRMGVSYVRGLHDAGILATGKHFPGHGNTATDSHISLPLVPGDYDQLMNNDLVPFKMAIDAGLDMVMTAHVTVPETDASYITGTKSPYNRFPTPATLSKKLLTDILRGDLGFKGIIVTDALEMAAINKNFGREDAVALCIKAGVDLPLMPGNTPFTDEAFTSLIASLKVKANADPELMTRIEESATRVIRFKIEKGIYHPDAGKNQPCFNTPLDIKIAHANATLRSTEHLAIEKEVSQAAVVLAANETIGGKPVLPFDLSNGDSILILQPADSLHAALLKNAVKNYLSNVGLTHQVTVISQTFDASATGFTDMHKFNIDNATHVIIGYPIWDISYCTTTGHAAGNGYARNVSAVWTYIQNNGYGSKSTGISTILPYDLMFLPYVSALVNCSSRHSDNSIRDDGLLPIYDYGIKAIFGEFSPSGKFPVSVPNPAVPGTFIRHAGDGLTYTFAESVRIKRPPERPLAGSNTYKMTATVLPENTDYKAVTWSVTGEGGQPTTRATIMADGTFTALEAGTVKITVVTRDRAARASSILVTIAAAPFLKPAPGQSIALPLKIGQNHQISLDTNAGAPLYMSSSSRVPVNRWGMITGTKAGIAVITVRSLTHPTHLFCILVNCSK